MMINWRIEISVFESNEKLCFSIKGDTLSKIKQAALAAIREKFPGKKNLYLKTKSGRVCAVVSNLDDIGEVRFERSADT